MLFSFKDTDTSLLIPCHSFRNCPVDISWTSAGSGLIILCPKFLANSYPSPVDPVLGYASEPVDIIIFFVLYRPLDVFIMNILFSFFMSFTSHSVIIFTLLIWHSFIRAV